MTPFDTGKTFFAVPNPLKEFFEPLLTPPGIAIVCMTLVDGLRIWMAYHNYLALNAMGWVEFNKRLIECNVNNHELTMAEYLFFRNTHKRHMLEIIVEETIDLCFKAIKFGTPYYGFVWKVTGKFNLPPSARCPLYAVVDYPSVVLQSAVTELVHLRFWSSSMERISPGSWIVSHVAAMTGRATTCFLFPISFQFLGLPLTLAVFGIYGICDTIYTYRQLETSEKSSRNVTDFSSMNEINQILKQSKYPIGRLRIVTSITKATGDRKHIGAKYKNFWIVDRLYISDSLLDKLSNAHAMIFVRHEMGQRKLWKYSYSYFKGLLLTILESLKTLVLLLAWGNPTIIRLFGLDPEVHPFIPFRIVWRGTFMAAKTVQDLIMGETEARAVFWADDYASDTIRRESPPATMIALIKLFEVDMLTFPMCSRWYARCVHYEPTLWERLQRINKRYPKV